AHDRWAWPFFVLNRAKFFSALFLMYLWREGLRVQFMDSAARAQSTQRLGRAEFLAFLEAFFCGFLFGLLHVVPPVSEIALRGRSNLDGPSCARRKGKSS